MAPCMVITIVRSHDHAQGHLCQEASNNAAAAAGAAQGATAPFTHIRSPTRGAPKAQSDASLENRILQLTETLYHIDLNGKPPRNHSNLLSPNLEEDSNQIIMVVMDISTHQMGDLSNKTSVENNKDSKEGSNSKDHLESLTKVPTQNAPESLVDLSIKIKSAALDAKNLATCKRLSRTEQTSTRGYIRTQEV